MNGLYNISVEREKGIFLEFVKEFVECKEQEQLMQAWEIKEKYSKWLKSFYTRNDNIGLFLFTEELKKYLNDNIDSMSEYEKSVIELNGINDVYENLYKRIVEEKKEVASDRVFEFINELKDLICEYNSWEKIPENSLNNYLSRVLNLCTTEELCYFINTFKVAANEVLKEVDPSYYNYSVSMLFVDVEQDIKAKIVNNEYGMCKMGSKLSSFELMALASKKIYDENPDKKELIDAYVCMFKEMGEKTENPDDSKTTSSQEWESLSANKKIGGALKRNITNLSFTKIKILAERKRLLQEIKDANAKTVILHGDSNVISNVLFDFKIGKGRVLAPELIPILTDVDFAIKEFAHGGSKTLSLYGYCKKKNVKVKPEFFCGCSMEEALSGTTKYPGSTLRDYIMIGYFPNSRINKTKNGIKGNIGAFEIGTFKAHNISTGEMIDDFRIVSRREKENEKAYVKKA